MQRKPRLSVVKKIINKIKKENITLLEAFIGVDLFYHDEVELCQDILKLKRR